MMLVSQKGLKFAAANTLNDIAFNSVRQIPIDAQRDLNFTKNARRALGFRVTKARARRNAKVQDLEAHVWTPRGWVAFHVNEGTRYAKTGWKFRGRNYLIVPRKAVKAAYFTTKGRLRAKFKRGIYIIPNSNGALVFHRGKRSKDTELIGYLIPQAQYHPDLKYEETVERLFRKDVTKFFKKNLKNEIRRNFRRK